MYSNFELNRELKTITRTCSINWQITFHKARHNFGTHITLSQGVPIETVCRMMGHKNITTTQIYAKVTEKGRRGYEAVKVRYQR
jgi:site-specific recombinase XerD